MAKILVELPYNYSQEDLVEFFKLHKWEKLQKTPNEWIHQGDGVKSESGNIARVMEIPKNEVGEKFLVLANNKLSASEMNLYFLGIQIPEEIKCPSCGSSEFDTVECAECGYSVFKSQDK